MKKLPKINTSKLLKAALPYILVGLMATKLGQAYRMASGGDVLDRIFGAFLKIGEAFASPLPSLHPFDRWWGLPAALCCGLSCIRNPRMPGNTGVVRSMGLPDGEMQKILSRSSTRIFRRISCCPKRNV